MITIARLEELERAAARCVDGGYPEWVLDVVRADELAELCECTRMAWQASAAALVKMGADAYGPDPFREKPREPERKPQRVAVGDEHGRAAGVRDDGDND